MTSPRISPEFGVIKRSLEQVLRGGLRPAWLVRCPEAVHLIPGSFQVTNGDALDNALIVENILVNAMEGLGDGAYGCAAKCLFGASSSTRGLLLKNRRRLAAEELGLLPSTFRKAYEDNILNDIVYELIRISRNHNDYREKHFDKPSGTRIIESRMIKTHAIRLVREEDLKAAVASLALDKGITAGIVLACVGSLSKLSLRMAGGQHSLIRIDDFEIVSLSGTISTAGLHLHLSASDRTGNVVGGHLTEGCVVRTTAELVIGDLSDVRFEREYDLETKYMELRIIKSNDRVAH